VGGTLGLKDGSFVVVRAGDGKRDDAREERGTSVLKCRGQASSFSGGSLLRRG